MGKLAAFDGSLGDNVVFEGYSGSEVPVIDLVKLGFQWLHFQSFGLGRTNICAVSAAHAIQRRNLNPIGQAFKAFARGWKSLKGTRCLLHLLVICHHRPDGCMGANKRTLVALDTVTGNPMGHIHSNTTLFVS